MALELKTEIEIDAPAERVWAILTDFAAYPSWNPLLVAIAGELEPDAQLTVKLRSPAGRDVTIKPFVTRVAPGGGFSWRGALLIPGLFGGEHAFELVPLGPGKVRLLHSERFSGVLVPLLRRTLDVDTRASFEAMNRALKARAEAA